MNNHYRTYMDRIHTPAELHDALTAGKPPSRQPSRVLRFVPAAACCALLGLVLYAAALLAQGLSVTVVFARFRTGLWGRRCAP